MRHTFGLDCFFFLSRDVQVELSGRSSNEVRRADDKVSGISALHLGDFQLTSVSESTDAEPTLRTDLQMKEKGNLAESVQ